MFPECQGFDVSNTRRGYWLKACCFTAAPSARTGTRLTPSSGTGPSGAASRGVGAVDDALASALSDVSSRRCVVVDAAKPTEATVAAGDVASRAELKTGRAARKRRVSV